MYAVFPDCPTDHSRSIVAATHVQPAQQHYAVVGVAFKVVSNVTQNNSNQMHIGHCNSPATEMTTPKAGTIPLQNAC
eukprot:1805228-Amphidinium_carterae.1